MKYKLKYKDKIQDTNFCCPDSLVDDIVSSLQYTREYECIDIIAHADVITEVICTLLNTEIDGKPFKFGMVDIDGCGFDYIGEYILSIKDDLTIWVEKVWRDGKLFDTNAYITYLHADCQYQILNKLEENDNNVLIFDFE